MQRWCTPDRLYGNVLERYFQDALDAVTAEAVAAGAYGSGTARYVQDAPLRLPEGATLRPVLVGRRGMAGCVRERCAWHTVLVQRAFDVDTYQKS